MMRDQSDDVQLARCIDAETVTGNGVVTGQTVDLAEFRAATIAISVGAIATAGAAFAVALNESPDGATWTPVAATDLIGTTAGASFTQADAGTPTAKRKLGYVGGMRYLQLVITPSGNTGSATFSGLAILGSAGNLPRSAQN